MKIKEAHISVSDGTPVGTTYNVTVTFTGAKDYSEAFALLNALGPLNGGGTLDDARVPQTATAKQDPLSDAESDELVRAELERQRKERGVPAPAPTKPTKPKPKPEPEPEPEEEPEEEEDEEPEEEEDEEPEAPAVKVKLTKELKSATKLREVVEILIGQGIRSKKQLILTCSKLKEAVPVLGKIADLEARVAKAVELVDSSIT